MRISNLLLPIFLFAVLMNGYGQEVSAAKESLAGITDSLQYTDALNRLALLMYQQNVDGTFLLTKQARQIAQRHNYFKGNIDALNNLGAVYFLKGNNQMALRYFNEANQGYHTLNDTSNIVQTLMNIGVVYRFMGKDEKALANMRDALQCGAHLLNDSIMAIAIANYVGTHWGDMGRDSITWYLQKAKKIGVAYHDTHILLALDGLVALSFIKDKQPEKAVDYLIKATNSTLEKKLYYYSVTTMADIGDMLAGSDSAKAVFYYTQGLSIAQQRNFFAFAQAITQKIIAFYQQHANKQLELYYSRMQLGFYVKKDSIDKASGVDYIEYAVKDQQVQTLQQKSTYQFRLLLMAVFIGFVAIVSLVAIGFSLKRTKRLNAKIKEQNNQMTKTLVALEQSQAENTRMMTIAAHDLRNPSSAIASLASAMLDEPERAEEDHKILGLIKSAAVSSLELVDSILEINVDADTLEKEPVDLDQMLHYCVDLLLNKASAKGQQISLTSEVVTVPANREKLWRVISNLIANAIKFSPLDSPILVNLQANAQTALITVKDHGIGIPEDMKNKIFDMFTVAQRRGTADEQPFGLGLAISKQIVEAHGGKIWFESQTENGTTFFVELPSS